MRNCLVHIMDPDFTFSLIRVIILLLGACTLSASLYGTLLTKRAPSKVVEKASEPPTITSRVPYIGHILEVMNSGFQEYFGQLSYEFTLC